MTPRRAEPAPAQRFLRSRRAQRLGGHSRPWVLAGLALAILLYVVVFSDTGILVVGAERAEVAELQERAEALREARTEIEARNAALLEKGSLELEEAARTRYLMRAPGEEVFHIVGGDDPADGSGHDEGIDPRP